MTTPASVLDLPAAVPPPGEFAVLRNHPAQSATTIDGWAAVLFGLPFLAVGIFTFLVAADVVPTRKHTPDWIVATVGSLFFSAGAFCFLHGLRGVARRAAFRRGAAAHPAEPWLFDYHWRREGIGFSALRDMLQRLFAACIWTAFVGIFGAIGFSARGAWPFAVGALIFGALGLIFWYRWGVMLVELLRYGNSYLSFASFPYFLGGRVNVRLRAPRHLAGLDQLTFTLRCVQECYLSTSSGGRQSTSVVCYELYKDSVTLDRGRLASLADAGIPVEFQLPGERRTASFENFPPPTSLAARPPIYWQIEAVGKGSRAPYQAYFLVPVYKSC